MFKKAVSLLYRDFLRMMTPVIDDLSDAFTKHICVTDQKVPAREMVGGYIFEFTEFTVGVFF